MKTPKEMAKALESASYWRFDLLASGKVACTPEMLSDIKRLLREGAAMILAQEKTITEKTQDIESLIELYEGEA